MANNRVYDEDGGGHYSHYYVTDITRPVAKPSRAKSTETISSPKRLDEAERGKIEMFYRSHRTFIYVGHCLANLYFTDTELVDGGRKSRPLRQDWQLTLTGVPLLLLNKGDTKSRDKRQLRICLAQVGTGFPLWADIIDNLSDYQADGNTTTFQTMYLSTDHRKMAGFSFDCRQAAEAFLAQVEAIVSNPLNISLTGPKRKLQPLKLFSRRRSKSVGRLNDKSEAMECEGTKEKNKTCKSKSPKKADISSPCLFQHITTVNLYNCDPVTLAMVAPAPPSRTSTAMSIESPVYSTPEPMSMSCSSRSSTSSSSTPHYDRRRKLAPPIPLDRTTSFHEVSSEQSSSHPGSCALPPHHFVSSSNSSNFSY